MQRTMGAEMKSLEHSEQVTLIKWWALACKQFGIPEQLLFAIPNGGKRDVISAKLLKDEGVRAGVPDLFECLFSVINTFIEFCKLNFKRLFLAFFTQSLIRCVKIVLIVLD